MQQAKVTYKGQITIPKAIRNALNIQKGDSVSLRVEGDHAILIDHGGTEIPSRELRWRVFHSHD